MITQDFIIDSWCFSSIENIVLGYNFIFSNEVTVRFKTVNNLIWLHYGVFSITNLFAVVFDSFQLTHAILELLARFVPSLNVSKLTFAVERINSRFSCTGSTDSSVSLYHSKPFLQLIRNGLTKVGRC